MPTMSIERMTLRGAPRCDQNDLFAVDGGDELVLVESSGDTQVYRARFEGGFLVAILKFSKSDFSEDMSAAVMRGCLRLQVLHMFLQLIYYVTYTQGCHIHTTRMLQCLAFFLKK